MQCSPRLRRLFRFPSRSAEQVTEDVDQELRFHFEMRQRELVAAGLSADRAREQALRDFGDVEFTRRYCRDVDMRHESDVRRAELWDELRRDTRFALRQLRRSPGYTAVATLTLALGIGGTAAMFSVVDGVLLKPLPFRDTERVVTIRQYKSERGTREEVSPANFLDWRDRSRSFQSLAMAEPYGLDYQAPDGPVYFPTLLVSEGFFEALGTAPQLGRTLRPEEFVSGGEHVIVLGDGLWRSRFGADRSLVGRTIPLEGAAYTVAGIMPPGFRLPGGEEVFAPKIFAERDRRQRFGNYLTVVARLAPGVTREAAQAEMRAISAQLAAEYPSPNAGMQALIVPLREQLLGDVRPALLVMLGAVGFVLLIACANVANLSLARAVGREREFAIRAALGAARGRVIRQLVTESVVLAILGGTAGVLLARWGVEAVRVLSPADLPRVDAVAVDARVLGFALLVSVLTALVFGLAPALHASRSDLQGGLKAGGRSGMSARGSHRLRGALVVSEIALAMVLLVGAGLLARSFALLLDVNPGFSPANVLVTTVQAWGYYPTPADRASFVHQTLERIAALPGVRATGVTSSLPFGDQIGAEQASFVVEGRPMPAGDELPTVHATSATEGYFRALGIPLRRGRLFTDADNATAPPVAVINETLARRYWPDEDPVGKKIRLAFAGPPVVREIIGVVADVRHRGLHEEPRASVFVPHPQAATGALTFTVRTRGDPIALLGAVREEIWALNHSMPIHSETALELLLSESLRERRFHLALLGAFSLVALALAAIGIYGVMSHATTERTQEIGLRMALGARSGDVLALVMRQGGALAMLGIILGLGGAAALTRVLRGMLYRIEPLDGITFALGAALVLALAAIACLVPARRAAGVDPVVALRSE